MLRAENPTFNDLRSDLDWARKVSGRGVII